MLFVEDVYGPVEVRDTLRYLSKHWVSKTFTDRDLSRVQALLVKYERVAA